MLIGMHGGRSGPQPLPAPTRLAGGALPVPIPERTQAVSRHRLLEGAALRLLEKQEPAAGESTG